MIDQRIRQQRIGQASFAEMKMAIGELAFRCADLAGQLEDARVTIEALQAELSAKEGEQK